MQQIKNLWKNERGEANIFYIILFIILFVIFTAFVSQIYKVLTTSQTVQATVQQAVTAIAAKNAYNIYGGVRESNTANSTGTGTSWVDIALTKDVKAQVTSLMRLTSNGNNLESLSNTGFLDWTVQDMSVDYTGTTIRSNNSVCLNFTTTFTLIIPLRFGSAQPITTVSLPIKVKSTYTPLY